MTVERINGEVNFVCDNCQADLDTGEKDFTEARQVAQREGWTSIYTNDGWENLCPSCQKAAPKFKIMEK